MFSRGMIDKYLIGLFILENGLTGEDSFSLRKELIAKRKKRKDVTVNIRMQKYYQHEGAPALFARQVKKFLGLWISRGGPIIWPPRFPELTPLNF